jgi:3-hydroxyacyl-[acyl-carrier-protein] dehydratase
VNTNTIPSSIDIKGIIRHQRNKYPVLLIDKIIDLVPGKSATGIKCFTYNEWFFPGHFDDDPNVPGTIQIESMAQTLLMTFQCLTEYQGMKANASMYRRVNFKRRIVPGDVLIMDAELKSFKRGVAIGHVKGKVAEYDACSAEFVIVIPDILNQYAPKKTIIDQATQGDF